MSFFNVSLPVLLAGLVGLAGLLFVLQQLRVRHTEIAVPTTMFWAAAVREAPVRVFRRRFRHWLAWLLAFLICGLLWLGFAGPAIENEGAADFHVLYLDGSAHTSDAEDFEDARQRLLDDIADLPAGTREVVFGGAHNVKLLTAGEDKLVLEQRLASLQPEAAPSRIDDQLRLMAKSSAYPENVRVSIYGRAPVRQGTLDSLPPGFEVIRAGRYDANGENAGISALGVGEAVSGAWDRVDVAISVTTTEGLVVDAADLSVSAEGRGELQVSQAGAGKFVVADVFADGAVLDVRLNRDDKLPLDNVARLTLPVRSIVRVAVIGNFSDALRNAITADRGVTLVSDTDDADVIVRHAAQSDSPDKPVLNVVSMANQQAAFMIGYQGELDTEAALQDSVARLGLDQIDGTGLATAVDREIAVSVYESDRRSVSMWSELLDETYNFTGSRSFPVLVSRTLRWLAGETPWYASVAAGRPAYDQTARSLLASTSNGTVGPLAGGYAPPRAGTLNNAGVQQLEVSLLDDEVSALSGGAALGAVAGVADTPSSIGFVTWLIIVVILLLALEWYLYQRGLMP